MTRSFDPSFVVGRKATGEQDRLCEYLRELFQNAIKGIVYRNICWEIILYQKFILLKIMFLQKLKEMFGKDSTGVFSGIEGIPVGQLTEPTVQRLPEMAYECKSIE